MNFSSMIFQLIIILTLSPLSMGLVRLFKARLQGRQGASPLLPYFTLATLMKKQMVISTSTSWVFRLVPFVVLGSTIFLAANLPLIAAGGANLFVISGILMIGAAFLVLGGLDSASAFGGMGASREMTIAALVEPAMIMIFGSLAVLTGSTNIGVMLSTHPNLAQTPSLILILFAMGLVALAENARYPVDNPATHLELTMVHEAMILEYSGPYLAMLEYASYIKLTVFGLLLANFIWPSTLDAGIVFATVFALGKIVLLTAALALLESLIAKMRFYRMQEYLSGAFFLALAGMIMVLIQNAV